MSGNTEVLDYAGVFRDLGEAKLDYFLEGGQAVNFWAEFHAAREAVDGSFAEFRPYTSKDCDLWVSHPALQHFKGRADGKCILGDSPADGQVAIFIVAGKRPLKIDLMSGVYGIPPRTIPRVLRRSLEVGGSV